MISRAEIKKKKKKRKKKKKKGMAEVIKPNTVVCGSGYFAKATCFLVKRVSSVHVLPSINIESVIYFEVNNLDSL